MNEISEYQETRINEHADIMLALFQEHSVARFVAPEDEDPVHFVSDDGRQVLSDYFGTVPEDLRGYVFLFFLSKLYEAGIIYDMQQFLDTPDTLGEKVVSMVEVGKGERIN
jgi:hypothetical protein